MKYKKFVKALLFLVTTQSIAACSAPSGPVVINYGHFPTKVGSKFIIINPGSDIPQHSIDQIGECLRRGDVPAANSPVYVVQLAHERRQGKAYLVPPASSRPFSLALDKPSPKPHFGKSVETLSMTITNSVDTKEAYKAVATRPSRERSSDKSVPALFQQLCDNIRSFYTQ